MGPALIPLLYGAPYRDPYGRTSSICVPQRANMATALNVAANIAGIAGIAGIAAKAEAELKGKIDSAAHSGYAATLTGTWRGCGHRMRAAGPSRRLLVAPPIPWADR